MSLGVNESGQTQTPAAMTSVRISSFPRFFLNFFLYFYHPFFRLLYSSFFSLPFFVLSPPTSVINGHTLVPVRAFLRNYAEFPWHTIKLFCCYINCALHINLACFLVLMPTHYRSDLFQLVALVYTNIKVTEHASASRRIHHHVGITFVLISPLVCNMGLTATLRYAEFHVANPATNGPV